MTWTEVTGPLLVGIEDGASLHAVEAEPPTAAKRRARRLHLCLVGCPQLGSESALGRRRVVVYGLGEGHPDRRVGDAQACRRPTALYERQGHVTFDQGT